MTLTPANAAEIQEIVHQALADRTPVEAVGGGTQLHVGYESDVPCRRVSTRNLNLVSDYVPEDLVVVSGAGMTVLGLNEILAQNGQTLPLEAALPGTQTLGGIVASRANSLSRAGHGSVRDWLIGCKVVGGTGDLIVGGGKVVKNVAGYDLPKLYCGSWGTLGIITEVAFKLAPLPPASAMLLVTLNTERNSEEALDAAHRAFNPTFTYLMNPDAAAAVLGQGAPSAQFLAICFDGQPEEVTALADRAKRALADHAFQILDLTPDVGVKLRSVLRDLPLQEAPLTIRFNILSSQVGAFARMIEWTARRAGFSAQVFGDAIAGILWAHVFPRDVEEDGELSGRWMRLYPDLRDKADRVGGSYVLERIPRSWREAGFPIWSPVLPEGEWTRRIKQKLDPHNIFRPGRFVVS